MPGMSGPVGGTDSAEDIGDLERGAHRLSVGRDPSGHEQTELIERTGHGAHGAGRRRRGSSLLYIRAVARA